MKLTRWLLLLKGIVLGCAYALIVMLVVSKLHESVSIAYIFVLPAIMGVVPVLFATKEQLTSYLNIIVIPWASVIFFCALSILLHLEGFICLVIIIGPFLLLGTLSAFVVRIIRLKRNGPKTPLYCSLLLPFIVIAIEGFFPATDQYHTVSTSIVINSVRTTVWDNIKNLKNIQPAEIKTHFVHVIGIPKPLNGQLSAGGIGGIRSITWEKGIKFSELINQWNEGKGFKYIIKVDPNSIAPTTLDEHVIIGGRYFDVLAGSYDIKSLNARKNRVTLTCKYRITTNFNFYSKWWADYILDDFNSMILEVIKSRCEK